MWLNNNSACTPEDAVMSGLLGHMSETVNLGCDKAAPLFDFDKHDEPVYVLKDVNFISDASDGYKHSFNK